MKKLVKALQEVASELRAIRKELEDLGVIANEVATDSHEMAAEIRLIREKAK